MSRNPEPVDVHVGAKLRSTRKLQGVSQQAIAAQVGVTFQQIQKYERGDNRISASMLVKLATALSVRPSYFIDDAPGALQSLPQIDGWVDAQRIIGTVSGAMEALYCLDAIDGEVRGSVVTLLRHVSGRSDKSRRAA